MKLNSKQVDELISDTETIIKLIKNIVNKWEPHFENGYPVTENVKDANRLEEAIARFDLEMRETMCKSGV